jgi:hypothetical protein
VPLDPRADGGEAGELVGPVAVGDPALELGPVGGEQVDVDRVDERGGLGAGAGVGGGADDDGPYARVGGECGEGVGEVVLAGPLAVVAVADGEAGGARRGGLARCRCSPRKPSGSSPGLLAAA